jgi:Mechanosensitive ion channel, beta-domain
MESLLQQVASLPLSVKLACAVLGILVAHPAFRLLETVLPRHFERADARYRARKFVVFVGYVVAILFLIILFEDRLGQLGLALGVAGAAVVVALQDAIASIAGWCAISFSKLYTVGDRIQIGETKGDVIDISILRTTLLETGNWVSRDLYNGRIARVPNSFVLKGPVFNYSQRFRFVWDEIKVPLTAQSDHRLAREMLLRVAEETVAQFLTEAERTWKQITDNFRIANPRLEPIVAFVVNGGCLEFTVSYIVDYTAGTVMKDRLFTKIADEIAKSNGRLHWASSSTTAPKRAARADGSRKKTSQRSSATRRVVRVAHSSPSPGRGDGL